MRYSFSVRAATKAEAKAAVAAKFAKVTKGQACHERDKSQALAAADAFIDLLADDDTKNIDVSLSGHLAGQWQGSDVTSISGAAVSVSAGHATRDA